MPHISTRLIYELDILHFIAYYLLYFSHLSNFTYDVMGPRLWCYYVYYGIVIMMLLCLWCHHDYYVTMFMRLQCVDYHWITVFYDDSICWNVFIYQMWNIWCGTWIPCYNVINWIIICHVNLWWIKLLHEIMMRMIMWSIDYQVELLVIHVYLWSTNPHEIGATW